jgi:hypothetical protein
MAHMGNALYQNTVGPAYDQFKPLAQGLSSIFNQKTAPGGAVANANPTNPGENQANQMNAGVFHNTDGDPAFTGGYSRSGLVGGSLTGNIQKPATPEQPVTQDTQPPTEDNISKYTGYAAGLTNPGILATEKALLGPTKQIAGNVFTRAMGFPVRQPLGALNVFNKSIGRVAAPLGFGMQAAEGAMMSPDEARQQAREKLDSVKDVSDLPGYIGGNALNMGRNARAVVTTAGDAINERQNADTGAYANDVMEAKLLQRQIASSTLSPEFKTQAQNRLNQLKQKYSKDETFGRKSYVPLGVPATKERLEAQKKFRDAGAMFDEE